MNHTSACLNIIRENENTDLLPIQKHISMYDQSPGLIHTLRQASSENHHINPPLNLDKHQTSDRRKGLALVLLLLLHLSARHSILPSPLVQQYTLVRECVCAFPWSDIRNGVGQVPTFEETFVDKVSVVCSYERFTDPTLLEEGHGFALVFEVGDGLKTTERSSPEVVQVFR